MTSKFAQALEATREKKAALPQGNVVFKITSIGDKTFTGTVESGPAKGTEITVAAEGKTGKGLKMDEYKDPENLAYVLVGDLLRLESLEFGTDYFTARWTKPWLQSKNEGPREVIFDVPTSFVDLDAASTRTEGVRDSKGAKLMLVNVLHAEDEKFVKTLDEMRDALTEALNDKGCVNVFLTDPETGNMVEMNYRVKTNTVDGKREPEDIPAKVDGIMQSFSGYAGIEAMLAETGMSVVPTSSNLVGSKTAKGIEKDMKDREKGKTVMTGTVNPDDFQTLTIGQRLAGSLKRSGQDAISAEYAAELIEKFKATAKDHAKTAFDSKGWAGVSDTDLRDFFASQDVTLRDHPKGGWCGSAVMLQDRKGATDGSQFVAKTFKTAAVAPYPPVKATEGLRKEYYAEMRDAVLAVCQGVKKEVAPVTAKADTPKADTSTAAAPAENVDAEEDGIDSDVDDILNDMMNDGGDFLNGKADEPMDLGN